MEVFLVPLGAERHELYCEVSSDADEAVAAEPETRGFFAGLRRQFREMLAAAEQDRSTKASAACEAPTSMWARLKGRTLAWVADAIAEQRLLWRLRHETAVRLYHPGDLTPEAALEMARASLTRDRDRHRLWLCVDSLLLLLCLALVIVPGPNLLGYYFAFRVVGHYLSWRGARQGLQVVAWELVASQPLTDLRGAFELHPAQRARHLIDIASRLRLDKLPTFVERVAYPGA